MTSDMHDSAGHLTALGWTTFALYMIAALLSFRAALIADRGAMVPTSRSPVVRRFCFQISAFQRLSETARVWIWLGVTLALLGLNKPLNLQTLLLELGRHIVGRENLPAHHTELRALFFLGFMLAIIALFAVVLSRWRAQIERFGRQLPLAAGGCALIGIYIVIRAASITSMDRMLGFDLERIPFLWLLEASGLMLIIIQALRSKRP